MNIFCTNLTRGVFCALLVSPALALDADQDLTSSRAGTHNGFYYNFWKDSGEVTFGLRDVGRYTAQWSNVNQMIGGIGWNPGRRNKVMGYSGQFNVSNSQNSSLSLYGWTTNPLIEYRIVESWGSYDPSSCARAGGQTYGTYQSDGATYELSRCTRSSMLGIEGPVNQYFSVRTPKKGFGAISGIITVANHFDAWASKGLPLGELNYMLFAIEGYQSNGSADITLMDPSPSVDCGELGGVPVCCNISADPDGDGMGFQNNGEECIVTEETDGWNSASSSSSSSSSTSSGSSNTGGGSSGWFFLVMIGGLMVFRNPRFYRP